MDNLGTGIEMLAAAAVGGVVASTVAAALFPWYVVPVAGGLGAWTAATIVSLWRM